MELYNIPSLCLVPFVSYCVFRVHVCGSLCQTWFLFMAEQYPIVRTHRISFTHLPADGPSGCFHCLPIVMSAAVDICVSHGHSKSVLSSQHHVLTPRHDTPQELPPHPHPHAPSMALTFFRLGQPRLLQTPGIRLNVLPALVSLDRQVCP